MHKLRFFSILAAVLLTVGVTVYLLLLPVYAGRNCTFSFIPIVCSDISKNGRISAENISDVKRETLNCQKLKELNETYRTVPLTEPPFSRLNAPMPSTGTVRIVVAAVSFPDYGFPDNAAEPTQILNNLLFEKEGPMAPAYPLESITAFYERASYGRLHIEGDVFSYQAEKPAKEYTWMQNALMSELMQALDDQIDYRDYDSNQDGVLDGIIAIVPETIRDRDDNRDSQKDWWPCNLPFYGKAEADGVRMSRYCIGTYPFGNAAEFTGTWIHELGHEMGLPDYYRYSVEKEDPNQTIYGLNGNAGWEIMDERRGDFSAFSKLMLGWITKNEAQFYHGGTQTFRLYPAQCRPSCIVIPRDTSDDLCSEFFLVEYQIPQLNCSSFRALVDKQKLFDSGGIRILHCDTHISEEKEGPELTWCNLSDTYDDTNMKQRVLRLVNEAEGGDFFGFGTQFSSSAYSEFRWYDSEGFRTIDPKLSVTISGLNGTSPFDSYCEITISDTAVN